MVSPYISRRILLHTLPISGSFSFIWNEFFEFSSSLSLPRENIVIRKIEVLLILFKLRHIMWVIFCFNVSIIRGHNRKKSTFRFFVLVEEYQRRMERDEKDLRDTKQAHSECEQEASLVVCLNYKIIRERHKKLHISWWSHDNHDES